MTRRINYDDDIFALALMVRCLRDMVKLEIDVEFFRDRILGDIAFLHATIGEVYQSLSARPSFAKRREHLKEIQRLKSSFAALIGEMSHIGGALPLADIRASHEADIIEIGRMVAAREKASPEEAGIISQEELEILFAPREE